MAKAFLSAWIEANESKDISSYRRILISDNMTYCFLFQDDNDPSREKRKDHLGTICFIARGKCKENKIVIGIATEKKIKETCSYDFCMLFLPEWNDELQKSAEEIQNKYKIFLKSSIHYIREEEYPEN